MNVDGYMIDGGRGLLPAARRRDAHAALADQKFNKPGGVARRKPSPADDNNGSPTSDALLEFRFDAWNLALFDGEVTVQFVKRPQPLKDRMAALATARTAVGAPATIELLGDDRPTEVSGWCTFKTPEAGLDFVRRRPAASPPAPAPP